MAESSLFGFLDIRAAAPVLLLAAVAFYVVMEQLSYRRKKGPLPGPLLVVPFFGSIAPLIATRRHTGTGWRRAPRRRSWASRRTTSWGRSWCSSATRN